jgi:hypothetical protein
MIVRSLNPAGKEENKHCCPDAAQDGNKRNI